MIAYHATPTRNVIRILSQGLRADAPGSGATNMPGVYFATGPLAAVAFVAGVYQTTRVTVLAVDLAGLEILPGDDDDDLRVAGPVSTDRIRVAQVYR